MRPSHPDHADQQLLRSVRLKPRIRQICLRLLDRAIIAASPLHESVPVTFALPIAAHRRAVVDPVRGGLRFGPAAQPAQRSGIPRRTTTNAARS